jgi:hypothetical protein
MKPELLAGLSDSEKAYFTSGGQVDPVTGKTAEESNASESRVSDAVPGGTDARPAGDSPEGGDNQGGDQEGGPEAEADGESDEGEDVAEETTEDGQPKRKLIEFTKFDSVRHKAKAYKQELEQTRQQLAYLTGLMQQRQGGPQAPAQAAQPQGPQQPVTAPDPQKEPQKWLEWVNSTLTAAQQQQAQQQQQAAQTQQVDRLNAAAYQAEQEFVNGDGVDIDPHPDYYDAIKYLDTARRTELKLAGYDPQTAQAIIDAQNKDIAMRALNAGDNAAKRFYTLAKSRGFKAGPAPSTINNALREQGRNAAGQFTKSPAEKVAEQAKKQATNKSIAGLAGAGAGELSLESLANTPTDEFAKMFKEGKVQKMLGIPV